MPCVDMACLVVLLFRPIYCTPKTKHCEIHDRNYSSVGFVPTRQAIPTMTRHDTNSQA